MSIKEHTRRIYLKNYLMLFIAAILYGASISLFLDPNDIAPGGVSGLSIIINRLIPIGTGTLMLIFNIPILCLGLWRFGFRFLISTIYTIVISSAAANYLAGFEPITQDPLLAAAMGGALSAFSIGIVFKNGGTTGGTDIIVKVLRQKYRHLKTGKLFMMCDLVVVALSAVVFQNIDSALYAALCALLMSYVFDFVLYGADGAKLIYIISDKSDELAKRLLDEVGVGVTYLRGEGAYSGIRKQIIMCVVRIQVAPQVEEIVKEEDGNAFMIVSSAAEIYGQGYKNIYSEKL